LTNIRLATFNCNNLFQRFKFGSGVDQSHVINEGWLANMLDVQLFNETEKALTAAAIMETKADIIALQEVESMNTLRLFRDRYLGGRQNFPHGILISGNDPRLINVAVLSKYPIRSIETHVDEWDEEFQRPLFKRDCLECDIDISSSNKIRIFVNHFKSMYDRNEPCNGRSKSMKERSRQAQRVKELVLKRFPGGDGMYAILGDFNDYLETDSQRISAINDLVKWHKVVNVIERLPLGERWTIYFEGNKQCGQGPTYRQLDFILLSKSLAENNQSAIPTIIRKGIQKTATLYKGPRFEGIGDVTPRASDHCPVVIELKI
jgi:endonuclease/exonuclease/phosphatase family metal-dependent hydrolase